VQAGLLQVRLEVRQEEIPPALGADVGGAVFVHPLVGVEAAAVGHDHGTRRTDLGGREHREVQPGASPPAPKGFPAPHRRAGQRPATPAAAPAAPHQGSRSAGTLQGTSQEITGSRQLAG